VKHVLRALAAAGLALVFVLYLKQSRTVSVGSDGGSIALQAWDMLHGNLLLHGWAMSDCPYYTTGLPEYMLLERIGGLGPGVVHAGGALTYAIAVLLAGLVARGRATGAQGLTRALIGAGIMLAPAPGDATYTLLLTPDHFTSAIPVLLAWLAIDRCGRRWYGPAAAGLLLTWGLVADPLTEVIGVVPLVAVCGLRTLQHVRARHARRHSSERPVVPGSPAALPPWWYEPSLIVASLAAVAAAALISALIRAWGGFTLQPVSTTLESGTRLLYNAFLTGQGLLELFGALFGRGQPVNMVFSVLHLAGVALAAAAMVIAIRRLARRDELMVPGLALAIIANVAVYLPGWYVQDLLSTREISAVLPLGAAMAGRVMADPVLRLRIGQVRVAAAGLGMVLAGYLVALGVYSSQPPQPAQQQNLAGWLAANGLGRGLSPGYWTANAVTMDSAGRVAVRQVAVSGTSMVRPPSTDWGFAGRWYNPAVSRADFVITSATPGSAQWQSQTVAARRTFGPPAYIRRYRQYTILIWHRNVLIALGVTRTQPGPGAVVVARRDVACACGPAHLRARERVRRNLYLPWAATPVARRGSTLPVPAGRVVGQEQQRLPAKRRTAVPGRRQPS
jgi:hypothetical protein